MMASNAGLPPMAEISIIGIWVETVLYGVNCAMYGLSMVVLLHEGKIVPVRWVLVVMSTILFLLCTAHIIASLQQLLDAFVYAPVDVPDYSTTYWLNLTTMPRVLKDNLYCTLALAQHAILVWRLYVVFMYDRRIIILPIMLMAGFAGSAYTSSMLSDDEPAVSSSLLLSAWVFAFTLNVSVTLAIVGRLWWMGRTIASLTATSANRFTSSIYIAIESGVLPTASSTVVLALYANRNALVGLDIASQLLALAPLLIVVQLGLIGRYRTPSNAVQDEIVSRADVSRRQRSPRVTLPRPG